MCLSVFFVNVLFFVMVYDFLIFDNWVLMLNNVGLMFWSFMEDFDVGMRFI